MSTSTPNLRPARIICQCSILLLIGFFISLNKLRCRAMSHRSTAGRAGCSSSSRWSCRPRTPAVLTSRNGTGFACLSGTAGCRLHREPRAEPDSRCYLSGARNSIGPDRSVLDGEIAIAAASKLERLSARWRAANAVEIYVMRHDGISVFRCGTQRREATGGHALLG
jgi:hypothetical protein